ncbi:taste receptor type 1 member 1 isoform X1 [Hemicordylus capensis]|uniref:taste receptor type 1 member 1 isoform X1 n=1 Tax=Hemicordylus capensis TaxID=884348 RepID=UPI002302CB18|nr:taste receptor type 1 member 1 isoform X1 [Hemicordylus capensis]XP_053137034.1 taste receptor type 1 member 1 isoform X1 [Hemicordylus capensis]
MGPSLPTLPWLLLLVLGQDVVQSQGPGLPSPLRLDGDHTIAGLFPIHRMRGYRKKTRPEVDVCESIPEPSLHGYHLVQAMRFAVEEINNASNLLPGLTLGYEIYDTCSLSSTIYATLSLLAQGKGRRHLAVAANYTSYLPTAVAVIGPDASENALTTAGLLGLFQVPEVSYEASSPTLSEKRTYPSFLRTIPSDRLQVEALVRLLGTFNWTWVAVVSSDNTYGRQGLQMLREVATNTGLCFAYQGVMPSDEPIGSLALVAPVQELVGSRAHVAIVFANKHSALPFFHEVVRQNVTGMVWLGTEDWSLAQEIWEIPGVCGTGTVLGLSVQREHLPGLKPFEAASARVENASAHLDRWGSSASLRQDSGEDCSPLCTQFSRPLAAARQEASPYDMQGAFNVYVAVYALAHSLHGLLGCQAGTCRKDTVYPWQLLKEVKQVKFSLSGREIHFDSFGDPLTGYDVVLWKWMGRAWSYSIIGSFDRNPDRLSINWERLLWHTEDNQVPVSVCSQECGVGEQKVRHGIHRCCFHCVACSAGTFLNKSNVYACQECREDQWAPARSEACFSRVAVFLPWGDKISLALLVAITLLLVLLLGTMAVFAQHRHTPVVRSAGGWLCFAMLASLACASLSLYCYFGAPNRLSCPLRYPMYNLSLTICLSCMLARSVQIVIVFKWASKVPRLYEAWRARHGPLWLIGTVVALQGLILLLYLSHGGLSVPQKNYAFQGLVVLECQSSCALILEFGPLYNGLLGLLCFAICYIGKDLPNSYNEAKCITGSLFLYFLSFLFYSTVLGMYHGKYLQAIIMASHFTTLCGMFGNYFAPKAYVILCRPERNTNEHFQMSIQSYTQRGHE